MGASMVQVSRLGRILFLAAIVAYIAIPMIAVLLYSFSTRWTSNLLPDGYTLEHWRSAFTDQRLLDSLWRTTWMASLVLLLDILIVVPAVFWQRVRNPRIRYVSELLAAIPFALPFVVIAFGILKMMGNTIPEVSNSVGAALGPAGRPFEAFGDWLPTMLGTPWLILFAHAAIAFPFLYWAVDGSMAAANIVRLDEAARACGATPLQILRHVVIPNIGAGLAAGGMLVFATSFGEFALVQILAGSRFENVSLYSLDLLNNTTSQVEKLAVLTIVTFVILFAISVGVVYANRGQSSRLLPGARAMGGER
jgi:putative spermidine/putrescine transport system permease protein